MTSSTAPATWSLPGWVPATATTPPIPCPTVSFVARKGFEIGWMDLHGQWVYCQNIFYSSGDDAENYYF